MDHNLKPKIADMIRTYRSDYQLSTIITSGLSAGVNIAFSLFNGIFGLIYLSVWHISVCAYYVFLLGIRAYILSSIRKKRESRAVYIRTHVFLLLMNISMILPIAIMVNGERDFTYGSIPAIAVAAYTTYRITMASVQLKKSRTSNSLLIMELRTINFVDALVAVITLQNTLIMANSGMTGEMRTLCSWTNGGIFCLMLYAVIRSFSLVKRSTAYEHKTHSEDPTEWGIDEEAAEVIRKIFDLFMQGRVPSQVTAQLEKDEMLDPTACKQREGGKTPHRTPEDDCR